MTSRGPRIARALLAALVPADERHAMLRDIDEEFAGHILPARGGVRARAWYWRQVLGSVRPALAMRRRRSGLFDRSSRDALFALRALRRRPLLSAVAIATFALGIGVNTTIFSIVDAVVLRPLPYASPDRLVRIWSANPRGIPRNLVSPADYFDFEAQAVGRHGFTGLAAFTAGDTMTLRTGEPSRVVTSTVSPTFFDVLGVYPVRGRTLAAGDGAKGAARVAIVSDRFWRTRMHEAAPGGTISLDAEPVTVVGIMPASFAFPVPAVDIWLPMRSTERERSRSAHYLDVIGRLHPSSSVMGAADALRTVAARLEMAHPDTNRGWSVTVEPLHESIVGDVRRPLFVLLAAVACVLLIACANVAGLLLANGHDRARELALRAALGAAPARLLKQQLLESLILAAAGAVAAVLIAHGALGLLQQLEGLALPRAETIGLDQRVLVLAAFVAMVAGLLAGAAPALRAAHTDPDRSLRGSRAAGSSLPARRVRSALVIGQVAVTLALAVGAGLLVRSFVKLTSVDAGFTTENVLLAQVSLGVTRYEPERWASYVERGEQALSTLPGVVAVGAGAPLPLAGQEGLMRFGVRIDGRPAPTDGRSDRAYLRRATPGYFRAMGIPILHGRPFEPGDGSRGLPVAVVDRTFVDRYLPEGDPVGRRIQMSNERAPRTVVGVVGPVRQTRLDSTADPHVYVPQAQNASPAVTFVIRAASDPQRLAAAVRDRLSAVDPAQPVYNVRPADALVAGSVASRKFSATVLALFASLAGLLTLIGIYGMMASWVAESKKEIGVRLALGAERREVLILVVRRGVRLTVMGLLVGLPLAIAATSAVRALLFEVPARDGPTFVGAVALLVLVGLAGSYLPARRAVAINPVDSLRDG